MAEEIRTEIVADPTKHTAGVNQAKKDAQEFGKQWEREAAKVETSGKRMNEQLGGPPAQKTIGAVKQLSTAIGDIGRGGQSAEFALTNIARTVSDLAGQSTGAAKGILGVVASFTGWGAVVAGAAVGIGALVQGIRNFRQETKGTPQAVKANADYIAKESATLRAQFETLTADQLALVNPADMARYAAALKLGLDATQDVINQRIASAKERARQEAAAARSGTDEMKVVGSMEGGLDIAEAQATKAKEAGARRRAFDEKERQAAMAAADKLTADLLKSEERAHQEIANLDKLAASNRAFLRKLESDAEDQARAERLAKMEAERQAIKAAEDAAFAERLAMFREMQASFPGGALAAILFPPEEGANAILRDMDAVAIGTSAAATTISAAMAGAAQGVGQAFGQMIGSSVRYTHANKDAAKAAKALQLSTAQTVQVAVRETLKGVAQQAAVEAIFNTAKGIAASFVNPAAAGTFFAAAAMFAATAALAGAGAAAIGPVRKTIPDAGRGGAREASATGGGVGVGAKEGAVTQTVNVTVYTLPGTEANAVYEGVERGMNRARRERGKKELPA